MHPLAATHIRTKSLRHVEDERLLARLEHLRCSLTSGEPDGKAAFGDRTREALNIERQLAQRMIPFRRVTDGKHLAVNVYDVPHMGPRPSRKEQHDARMRRALLVAAD